MLKNKLKEKNIILASASPRRRELLSGLDFDFKIEVREVDETPPENLKGAEITDFIVKKKASAFDDLKDNDILITSDTLVLLDDEILGKPKNEEEAKRMLKKISGKKHQVITSVCFTTNQNQQTIHDSTDVYFRELSDKEIDYYVASYQPFNKAGSYGIQEWIGFIGVEKIDGCFFNVMGLPLRLVYDVLNNHF